MNVIAKIMMGVLNERLYSWVDKFITNSGVKQGCLLSPLLFALYHNDLHDFLGGGVQLNDTNVRLLMYADDK